MDQLTLRPRHDGWTAERQRLFLTALAETGTVSTACEEAGITPRSAYRLRADPRGAAFAAGWDAALHLAVGRLTAIAFERATRGVAKEIWRDGVLVGHIREPSDRMLMFLLRHLAPARFGREAGTAPALPVAPDPVALMATMAALADSPVAADPIDDWDENDAPTGGDA
ncbi:hypothetical protein [Sphingomonas mollis]|uniref:Helix-turn-helix domain-containing protein n=1 Tax=Sphingomonas mollis TaxID=2795726 RepID=A0ABS0XKR3_9SPHN|nr:hypothetical protein [Sphingomonas sp. BT553]MBJ6120350.1 hypothetical protein [Sphingomonas sp. BT553]